jgi:hypothetical protein
MVEEGYVNGMPKHRLPSAHSKEYDPAASAVFVVEWAEFEKLSKPQVQDIFRHRHILVINSPTSTLNFDEVGLSTLSALDQRCFFQGFYMLFIIFRV